MREGVSWLGVKKSLEFSPLSLFIQPRRQIH